MDVLLIRHETPADILAVRAVNKAAFETGAEAALVDALRENGKFTLSLVAAIEGEVVGHILFTDIIMEPGGAAPRILGLAPMAVLPGRQARGIGSALVRRGLEDCQELGYRGIVVLGHPAFYPLRLHPRQPPRHYQHLRSPRRGLHGCGVGGRGPAEGARTVSAGIRGGVTRLHRVEISKIIPAATSRIPSTSLRLVLSWKKKIEAAKVKISSIWPTART